ncbi:MAG: hypothetical protein ABI624_15615 [Casimicrobiaceae bacterium]
MTIIGTRTIAVVVALAALELSLRYAGGLGRWSASEQSERYGWRMLPSQDALSRELTVEEHINAAGFRDREWAPPQPDPVALAALKSQAEKDAKAAPPTKGPWLKDEGVFRVALVGNSMTFGTSVTMADTWGRQLEDALKQDFAARGVKRTPLVMNFAVQGYVFEQMARVYEDRIRPYRPDLLIIPMHPHDITPMKPAQDDPDYDFRTLILRSATYAWLSRDVINHWMPPPAPPAEALAARQAAEAADAAITFAPFAPGSQPYWATMIQRLDGMRQMVEADGGHLVIVSLPRWRSMFEPKLLGADSNWAPYAKLHPGTLHADPLPDFRPPMAALVKEITDKHIPATETYDLRTVTWKDAQGVEHLGTDLEHADDSLFLLYDTGHYTVAGHALLGPVVFRELSGAGMLP